MRTREDLGIGFPLAAILPLLVGAGMVSVRGEVSSAVTALVLALTVALGGRIGGRQGGIAAAFVAAASFDFFHTMPYRSLKIDNTDDILTTLLLLAVGLFVGSLAARMDQNAARIDNRERSVTAVHRVLLVAAEGPNEDIELAVRAELVELLHLEDCWFTRDEVLLPELRRPGQLSTTPELYRDGGFALPEDGVIVPVEAHGHRVGNLVCRPGARAGVSLSSRRSAIALGEVLGLALDARAA